MAIRLEKFQQQGQQALQKGWVRNVEFSGPTYQIEVVDPSTGESYWPFFQLDEKGRLQDAFCSCPAAETGCVHLAAGFLKIFEKEGLPLHVRFERSFWKRLCTLFAEHTGYDPKYLEKKSNTHYVYENLIRFEIQSKKILKDLFEKKQKETPENSLKFSNFSPEEIAFWKEGRPSKSLRFALSFWADLAKKMFFEEDNARVTFDEDENKLPTELYTKFPQWHISWKLTAHDLQELIETLDTVNANLKVFRLAKEKVSNITFDPSDKSLLIEHEKTPENHDLKGAIEIGQFAYISHKGFYFLDGNSLLSRKKIPKEMIPLFLEQHKSVLSRFIPVLEKVYPVSYEMFFDKKWNWHFFAYVFEKRDLSQKLSGFFGNWAYLKDRGFVPLQNAFFDTQEAILPQQEVSRFVNHHRVFLNSQEGFQTHLSSVESHLSYTVTDEGKLIFHAKALKEAGNEKDFGDWIYYENLGFFSKKHARLGYIVRPGLEVRELEISRFIKANKEELESVANFFTTEIPVRERKLEIGIASPTSIYVKPIDIGEEEKGYRYFGDFVYTPHQGFCELPFHLRFPEEYQTEKIISQNNLALFFAEELPFLKKFSLVIDPKLEISHKIDLEVDYLVRVVKGGLKAELYLCTEKGRVNVRELFDAFEKKRKMAFTEAGLIDLHDPKYYWIKQLRPFESDPKTFELSVMEFLRLDISFPLSTPRVDSPALEITRQLMKELREFSSHEKPNLAGLKSELRLYQETGVSWLWFLYKNGLSGLLCDDMGLGKTHQAMALMASILNQKEGEKKRFLIVCPTSVIYHWQDKLATFLPKVKVETFHGIKRSLKGFSKEGVLLTTYGILRREKKALGEIPFELAVFDEIQIAKNAKSRVHTSLLHIRAKMIAGLTGTPIENNLRELKALFDIVLPGYMPGEARFKELFINPIEKFNDEEKRALLSALIRPFVLRRRKTEVLKELPEKSVDKSYCELSSEQRELYVATLTKEKDQLIASLRDGTQDIDYIHIFALLSRLKQICNHPSLITKDAKNYQHHASGKWDLFVELLEEARESNQKVVVFSQYLIMLDIMGNYLKEKGWQYAEIRGSTQDRRGELKRFQEDPECFVFIGSLQAAGLGIDLTAASVVIMYDRWWNAAKENQAIDRVHRIGQKWGVQVYKLITKGTIEEKIDAMIQRKGKLLEEVIGADDEAVLKRFTRSELIELLSFNM